MIFWGIYLIYSFSKLWWNFFPVNSSLGQLWPVSKFKKLAYQIYFNVFFSVHRILQRGMFLMMYWAQKIVWFRCYQGNCDLNWVISFLIVIIYYFRSYAQFFLGPVILIGKYVDMIKDIILAYRLQFSLGGLATVFRQYEKFSSVVSRFMPCVSIRINPDLYILYNLNVDSSNLF